MRPAHCTALGKVMLASLSEDQLERFLERIELKPWTEKSITDIPTLVREVAKVRRTGVAYDEGEFNLEVRCIAVPVKDFTGQIVGALGISGPIWRQSNPVQQRKAKILQAAACRLSAAFGTPNTLASRKVP
jgi:IclR family transcriptional regulator, KDG regulon repressor